MRICMLSWRGPTHPNAGGAEAYTEMVLQGLIREGHQVDWYVGDPGTDRRVDRTRDGVPLVYGARGMAVYASGHRWLRRHHRSYDVVIDQLNTFGFVAPRVTRKTVALIHQLALDVWDYECPQGVRQIGRQIEQRVLQQYRMTPFVTVSPSTLSDLRAVGWKGPGQVIPNVLPASVQAVKTAKSENPSLIFLGRLGSQAKRLDHAVQVLQIVRERWPETELWVVGRGSPPASLGEVPGVTVFNNVDGPTRDRLLGQAWCLVATSVREGWGRMVMEAAVQGTPAIVYDVPGLRDAVMDGVTGKVVRPLVSEMARTVYEGFQNPQALDEWGQAAQRQAREYSLEEYTAAWHGVVVNVGSQRYSRNQQSGERPDSNHRVSTREVKASGE